MEFPLSYASNICIAGLPTVHPRGLHPAVSHAPPSSREDASVGGEGQGETGGDNACLDKAALLPNGQEGAVGVRKGDSGSIPLCPDRVSDRMTLAGVIHKHLQE